MSLSPPPPLLLLLPPLIHTQMCAQVVDVDGRQVLVIDEDSGHQKLDSVPTVPATTGSSSSSSGSSSGSGGGSSSRMRASDVSTVVAIGPMRPSGEPTDRSGSAEPGLIHGSAECISQGAPPGRVLRGVRV